jgi:hypothetical protein
MMTDQEYAKNGGEKCPHCGSSDLEGWGSFEIDNGTVWQSVHCGSCNESWNDVYKLIGWDAG